MGYKWAILLGLILILLPLPVRAAAGPHFEPVNCPFAPPEGETMTCGYLVVPEAHARPDGRTIRVGVTIVKSHGPQPAPDPIIYLRGGLDRSTQWFMEHEFGQVKPWLAKRDLILFDQRGMGWSQPALNCPEARDALWQEQTGVPLTLEEQLAPRLTCRDRWLQQGIDLAAYNSFETAADVADLRQALGYEQVNLIGASQWAIVAQLVMRDYGQTGQIRSAVLDSPVPLTVAATADNPAQLSASLARLFAACAADPLCRAAYPDLASAYSQVLTRLQAAPVTLSAVHPLTHAPFAFQFTIGDFGYWIQYSAYREIPALIYNVYDGDYRQIVANREAFLSELARSDAGAQFGFRTTMNCNEPWQTISPAQRAAMAAYPEAAFMAAPLDDALCAQWPAFSPAPQTLATGDIPTLIFTGGYDLRLPAAYGEWIAGSLDRGFPFHVPGASHVVLTSGGPCPNLMVLSFWDDPTRPPDSRCLASAGRTRFDTRFVIRAAAARRPVQALLVALGILLLGGVVAGALKIGRERKAGRSTGLMWRHNLRIIGWPSMLAGAVLLALAFGLIQVRWLTLQPAQIVALILPIVVAIQAAFLLSPEDEPALEVILATPRPPFRILLERGLVLFTGQGLVGMLASGYAAHLTGETVAGAILRWLPPLLFLSGLAIYVALTTRRAILGVWLACLLWIVLALFGDSVTARWPFTWPLHLYLAPNEPEYGLNRLLIAFLGGALLELAAVRLLFNPEYLLLGHAGTKRSSQTRPEKTRKVSPVPEEAGALRQPRQPVFIQLAAMTRYEFLLQWRQVLLPVVTVALLVTPVIGALMAQSDFAGYRTALAEGTLSLEVARARITAAMLTPLWVGILLNAVLVVPLVAAITIPQDRQIGMSELLEALPLSPGAYLTGKLLSLWLGLLIGVSVAALITGAVWWWGVGPFNWGLFLETWFVGGLGLILIQAGLSSLLAAGQPTRRRAVWIGGAYELLCLAGLALSGSAITTGSAWHWLNPARPLLVFYYLMGYPGAWENAEARIQAMAQWIRQITGHQAVWGSLGAGLGQVGLLWLLVWQWRKRRKS